MALETLAKAFEQSQIKKRPGSFGRMLEYIPANEVVKRLNESGSWNCRIIKEIIDENEVAVLIEDAGLRYREYLWSFNKRNQSGKK
jgi:hypothetical protein